MLQPGQVFHCSCLQPGQVSHCSCLQPEVSQQPAGAVWVGAAALFGCWTVFGLTVRVFGLAQELSGQSLQDTERVLELHRAVTGSGLKAGIQEHVWDHPRWDLQPLKRNNDLLIVQQHTKNFKAPFKIAKAHNAPE